VVALGRLPLEEPARATEQIRALGALGVTRVAHAGRYADATEFRRSVDALAALRC
jgi:hypothetical protein